MGDEGDERSSSRSRAGMDLNLYLGRSASVDMPDDNSNNNNNYFQSSTIPFHVVVPFTNDHLASESVVTEPVMMPGGGGGGQLPFVSAYLPSSVPVAVANAGGGSSSRHNVADMPERIRSLIESNRRVRARRFRSSLSYADDLHGLEEDRNLSDEAAVETLGKSKGNEDGVGKDDMEEEKEEKNADSVSFDCNICFDVAKEPVVTSCGHLFCWPCLYQWLHQYSDHKECPICKGQVSDANITPIYAHGSKEAVMEVIASHNGDPELKIPPRPRGRRFESLRQRIHRPFSRGDGLSDYRRFMLEESRNPVRFDGILDPVAVITRRLEEGVSSLQRHHLDEGLQRASRTDRYLDPSIQQIIDPRRGLTRLRARTRRLVRRLGDNQPTQQLDQSELEAGMNPIGVTVGISALNQQPGNSSSTLPEGNDSFERYAYDLSTETERLAAMHAQLSRLVSRIPGSSIRPTMASMTGNHPDTERQDIRNPQDSDNIVVQPPAAATQSAEQVSASSTMAVIQDDVGATDTSAEPNRAGTSRATRRRGRSSASCSLDVDGGNQTNKRRRLN